MKKRILITYRKSEQRKVNTMSWNPNLEALMPEKTNVDAIETVLVPRARDIGGFEVRRALPTKEKQMVGPFIFFDQIGPAEFLTSQGIDVRPHPHIGLATLTYLMKGSIEHRDSLGTHQTISAGDVNWMVAGNGITHSERTGMNKRASGHSLFGIQSWVALPAKDEDRGAFFSHHPELALPTLEDVGVKASLVAGSAWGGRSPVEQLSEMFYVDVKLEASASIPLPDEHEDRAVHVMQGEIEVADQIFETGNMIIFRPGDKISVKAGVKGARIILLGGATLEGPRYIWWNFVSSSLEKIEVAKTDWAAGEWENGRFQLPIGDKDEFIPLPNKLP